MNHDYAHCLDYNKDCPKSCFRAQLSEDLKKRTDLLGLPISWMHLKNTRECTMNINTSLSIGDRDEYDCSYEDDEEDEEY